MARTAQPNAGRARNSSAGRQPVKRVNVNYQIAKAEADKMQQEADRLNSFRSLAWNTAKGIPNAAASIIGQTIRHPVRTAGHIGTGVFNEGIRPMLNVPIRAATLNQAALPRINFKAQNNTEEGIQKGFGVGGAAGSYYAGGALLRPLLESSRAVNVLGRIPGAMSTTSRTPMLKPLAQTLLGDQILTQAYADKGTSMQDRAVAAAVTPLATLGMHAIGRGTSLARDRVRSALGDRIPDDVNLRDFQDIDMSKLSDDEALALMQRNSGMDPNLVRDPRTGMIDVEESVKKIQPSFNQQPVGRALNPLVEKAKGVIRSGRATVERAGESGKFFSKAADEYYLFKNQNRAAMMEQARQRLAGTTPDDWKKVFYAQEHPETRTLLNQKQRGLFDFWHDLRKGQHEFAVKNKWQLMGPDGKFKDWNTDEALADTSVPHYWFNDMPKPNQESMKQLMVDQLMKDGGYTRFQAEQLAIANMKPGPNKLLGSAEHARVQGLTGYAQGERLPDIIERNIGEYATMLSRVKYFGQHGEKMSAVIDDMVNKGVKVEDIRSILDELFGNSEVSNGFIRNALRFQQASKLSLSGVTNLTQAANTMTVGGIKNTLASVAKFFTSSKDRAVMKDFADIIGAVDQLNITQEANVPSTWIMDKALYVFKKTEEFNRIIAADVGKKFSDELVKRLAQNPTDRAATRMLMQLGLSSDDIAKASGSGLSKMQKMMLANKFVNDTQFQLNAMNLPIWSRTPLGKLFTQFKSFGYMQTKFWRDQIIREAQQGNYQPMLRMVATIPGLYLAAKEGRDILTIRDPQLREKLGLSNYEEPTEEENDRQRLEGVLGMTGTLPASLTQSMMYAGRNAFGEGSENRSLINKVGVTAGNILGPTVSDAANVIKAAEQSGQISRENNLEGNQGEGNQIRSSFPMEKFAVGTLPYIGQGLKNTFYRDWPEREREVYRRQLKELVKQYFDTRDPDLLEQIKGMADTPQKQNVLDDVRGEVRRESLPPEQQAIYNRLKEREKVFKSLPIIKE